MPSAAALRAQIEAVLADRIPSALTSSPRILRPVAPTGISPIDELLQGGLPLGAITEITGPECSGRTSLALSFAARATQAAKVCAWVDVSNALHPESAAATGVDLSRLLWIRCGVSQQLAQGSPKATLRKKPWSRIEQALRAADLLLQAGGFHAIVLDMGSIAAEHVTRIPPATWFRYRAAAERSQASILLLTQHACANSSAGLTLRLHAGDAIAREATVFHGIEHRLEVARERFPTASLNVLHMPPQSERHVRWQCRTVWTIQR